MKYYKSSGTASLGFANFAVNVTPLGVADFSNAVVVYPGPYSWGYWWEEPDDYDPLSVGGTNFLNVTVVPTVSPTGTGNPITAMGNNDTVAIVKIPLNASFCSSTINVSWRTTTDIEWKQFNS